MDIKVTKTKHAHISYAKYHNKDKYTKTSQLVTINEKTGAKKKTNVIQKQTQNAPTLITKTVNRKTYAKIRIQHKPAVI